MIKRMDAEKDHKQRMCEKREKRRVIRKLHDAIKSNNLTAVQKSIEEGVDINFHYGGITALQVAVPRGSLEMCRLLLACPGDVDQSNVDNMSLLCLAVEHNQPQIVAALLDKGADPDRANNNDDSPLHLAAHDGFSDIAAMLIDSDCNLNLCNARKQSPLAVAVAQGHGSIVSRLIGAGCDLNPRDDERRTPLVTAAQLPYLNIVTLLLEAGCELNAQDEYGRTALLFASLAGLTEIVRALVSAKADMDLCDTEGNSPLLVAIQSQHFDVIELLIRSGCDLDLCDFEYNRAAIHCAIRLATQYFGESTRQLSVVQSLVASNCSLDVQDRAGLCPLYQAASGHETEVVLLLLNEGVALDLVTNEGDTVLHGAVYGDNHDIMRMLIAAGCDVNRANAKNAVPLYNAIANRSDIRIIEQLIAAGSPLDTQESNTGATPLFAAIRNNYTQAADLLLRAGCDFNRPNDEGDTPLCVACEKDLEEMVATLLKQPNIDVNAGLCRIPLHAAAAKGFEGITKLLLDAGADVNKLSDLGVSALYLAVDLSHRNIARLLVYHGANPSAPHQMAPLPQRCCGAYADPHPHLELEPLCSAMRNDDFQSMKLILLATPQIRSETIRTLQDLMFRTPYAQEARLSGSVLAKHAAIFTAVLSMPRGLQLQCRGVIRERMGSQLLTNVHQLPLPTRVKDYIIMSKELGFD